jgi:hypothetical protein
VEVWLSNGSLFGSLLQSVASASHSGYTVPFTGSERIIPYNGCSSKLALEKKNASSIWQGLAFRDIIIVYLYRNSTVVFGDAHQRAWRQETRIGLQTAAAIE